LSPIPDFTAQVRCFAGDFGLTTAETRVLGAILGGSGLIAAAARLNITEATARTHLKTIIAKTGARRQTELIRRFFEQSLPRHARQGLRLPKK
jgi:DNA-binding CsgD family transcriptional regulator